ncbi:MAG: type III secretion system cytoplasmic ring protein SctQ [Planctomycetes bacterium]|nr:type III secretion system cytoplasmic ring protein SctQ [Planctomycetota bacterium]
MNDALIASWPRNLAKLNSRLAGRDIAVTLHCEKAGSIFLLRPDTANLEFPAGRNAWIKEEQNVFILKADGEDWEIMIQGLAAETVLAPPDGLNTEDIPEELQPALLALALEPLLDKASQALGHSLRFAWPPQSQTKDAAPDNHAREHFILPFTLVDSFGAPAGAGRARIPLSAAALSILTDLAKIFPRRAAADCSVLPVFLSLCVGQESFPIKILREAESGDVLRFSCPAKPSFTLSVNGRALWTASLSDGKISIEGILNNNPKEAAMDMPENAKVSAEPKAPGLSRENIDALEIIVTLVLDERCMTIGELAALGPGQILDTTASPDAPITIKAGGKTVGKGRLVEVGDNLGVLISSLELGAQNNDKSTA